MRTGRRSRGRSTDHFGFTAGEFRSRRALRAPAGIQRALDALPTTWQPVCFRWESGDAYEVEIVDYHSEGPPGRSVA